MDEPKILQDEEILDDKDIWYNTPDPDFVDLSLKSQVAGFWLSYQPVFASKWRDLPIKPVNNYVANIAERPDLLSIKDNIVTLRFKLYADMYLLVSDTDPKQDQGLYNVDRPWMRQYYKTSYVMPDRDDCFKPTYKFFVPWFVDRNTEVHYTPVDSSPVVVEPTSDFWFAPHPTTEFVSPHMVPFKFKNEGPHMQSQTLGLPRRNNPIFDMSFAADDIMVERIKEQYAND